MRHRLSLLGFLLFATPALAQPPTSFIQMKLADDPTFLARVEYMLTFVSRTVLAEATNTTCHTRRVVYARTVGNSDVIARAAVMIVGGPNLLGTVTYVPDDPQTAENEESVTTTVTDINLESQIVSFWSALAGCDLTGS